MTDTILQSLVLMLLLVLPVGALAARRMPWRVVARYAAAWVGVFVLLFLVVRLFT